MCAGRLALAARKSTVLVEAIDSMTTRRCLALDLRDDPQAIAEYEYWHRAENAWLEIVESIAGAGIAEMEIYRIGNRLFMVIDVEDHFDPGAKAAADAANPKVQEWEQLMQNFQQALPWSNGKVEWVELELIYKLSEAQADIDNR